MKNQFLILILSFLPTLFFAQNNASGPSAISFNSFIEYQKTLERPADAMKRKEGAIEKQFSEKGLIWPARFVYIRSFKYDSQLEVWVKNDRKDVYKLFKTYKVCALAGTLGPKRMEGDYQVPEGFYYINEFIHKKGEIGIDIESVNRDFGKVEKRYMSDQELRQTNGNQTLQCLYWCAKEAVFKLVKEDGIEFRQQIHIMPFNYLEESKFSVHFIAEKKDITFQLYFLTFSDQIMVWVSDSE